MQVRRRGFILVRAWNALRPVRSGVCIALHPKVLVVGGVQAGCERGLSPKSRLCGGQSAGCYSASECSELSELVLIVSPGSPFIASRGGRDLHGDWRFPSAEWKSNSPDPVEACPSRP